MPENDFEKQVQQLFDGFNLKPSDNVWHNVHDRIKKDKGNRKVIFWLPFLLLFLGGAGVYMIWGNKEGDKQLSNNNVAAKVSKNNIETEKNISATTETTSSSASGNVSTKSGDIIKGDKAIAVTENKPAIPPVEKNNNNNYKDGLGSDLVSINAAKKEKQAISQATDDKTLGSTSGDQSSLPAFKSTGKANNTLQTPISNSNKGENVNAIANQKNQQVGTNNKDNEEDIVGEYNGQLVQQSVLTTPQFVLAQPGAEKNIDGSLHNENPHAVTNAPIKLKKRKSIEIGVAGAAGVSKIGSGLSGIFDKFNLVEKASPMADATNNYYASIVASQNSNYLVAQPPAPTPVKPGFAWSGGASAKLYIKSRFALTGSLKYAYLSTTRAIGSKLNNNNLQSFGQSADARYAGVYSGTNTSQYTNEYHLFEIPLGIQWQINKGIKLPPVQLSTGLSVGWLINSNALHYNKTTGVYYEDKGLFNKMQAGVYAGLSVKLFQHSQTPLYIGPYVQYGLNNVLKSSSGTQQNFMSAGLRVEWILWRKTRK